MDIRKEQKKLREQIKRNNKEIEKIQKLNKKLNSNIKLLNIIYPILIIIILINTGAMIYTIFKMYIDPKSSFALYYYPSFLYVQFLIYCILKCRIIGFDNYEMKKPFNFNIYYYNFLILICSI